MYGHTPFNRRRFLKTAGAVGLLGGATRTGTAGPQSEGKPNELLIGVAPSANAVQTAERALPAEARIVDQNDTLGYVRAVLPDQASATAKARVAENVASRPGIEYAEPNAIHEALLVPNDPRFGDQYAPEMVNTPAAWDTTLGDGDVTIAIVDQGIKYDHLDLEDNMANGNGRDFVDDDSDPYPDVLADEHHGTHVAGIAAAGTDNNVGIAGISNASLLSVRALSEAGSGSTSDIADGIQWAADNGADVINLSLGGGGYTETLQNAVAYAQGKGVLLVAAAGNDDGGSVSYPAAYSECMAISALGPDGSLASYSNTGPEVELAAPGTNLLSTWTDDGYNSISGTSMAAPVVSGVAALVLSQPNFSNENARTQLKRTAVDIGLTSEKQGAGRIDAAAAVNEPFPRELTIVENGGTWTTYGFSVSGSISPRNNIGGADEISGDGTRATGGVIDGSDGYTITGEITSLSLSGDATVYLDGEAVNVEEYLPDVLTIEGSGSWSTYEFTASGGVAPRRYIGDADEIDTDVGRVSGGVGSGFDSYYIAGELTELSVDGNATVYRNGERLDVGGGATEHSLTIAENGGTWTTYGFSVSGSISPRNNIGGADEISGDGTRATGGVIDGSDGYTITGEITSLSLSGDATVYLDGEAVNVEEYLPDVLTIEGSGSWSTYEFTASGGVAPRRYIGDADEIDTDRDHVAGGVGSGFDSYHIAGELTDVSWDNGLTAYRNGERINP